MISKIRFSSRMAAIIVVFIASILAAFHFGARKDAFLNDSKLTFKFLNTNDYVVWDKGVFITKRDNYNYPDGVFLLVDRTLFGKYITINIDGRDEYKFNLALPYSRDEDLYFFIRKLPSLDLNATVYGKHENVLGFNEYIVNDDMVVFTDGGLGSKHAVFALYFEDNKLILKNNPSIY